MKSFVQVLLPLKLGWTPWYYTEEELRVGQRVGVVFARKQMVGVVLNVGGTPDIDESRVEKITCTGTGLADISSRELELWRFIAEYYMCTLGEVFKAAYPSSKINSEKIAVQQLRRSEASRARMEAVLAKRVATLAARLEAKEAAILARTQPSAETSAQTAISGQSNSPSTTAERCSSPFTSYSATSTSCNSPFTSCSATSASSRRCKAEVTARLQGERDALAAQLAAAQAALAAFRAGEPAGEGFACGADGEGGDEASSAAIAAAAVGSFSCESGDDGIAAATGCGVRSKPLLVRGFERTQFYMEQVRKCLSQGRDALILEPEAELGQNLEEPFAEAFGENLKLFGGSLSARDKRVLAQQIRGEHRPIVIIGQRSALFLPFTKLGLVVVDEEQDASYKQSEPAPRYNGRDLAVVLAQLHSAQLILGSACPSLESLYNSLSGKYLLLDLPQGATPAQVDIIDITAERRKNGMVGDFSRKAIDTLRKCPHDALVTVVRCFTSEEDTAAQLRELFPDRWSLAESEQQAGPGSIAESGQPTAPGAIAGPGVQIMTAYAARRSAAISDLTLVMQADALFDRADFRADEKALQLLTLLKSHTRRLIVQTSTSAHPVFAALQSSTSHPVSTAAQSTPEATGMTDHQTSTSAHPVFAAAPLSPTAVALAGPTTAAGALLAERKQFGLPPYTRIIDLHSRKDGTLVQRLVLPRDRNLATTKANLFSTRQDLWFDVDPQ